MNGSTPADQITAAAVTGLIRESIACANANAPLSEFALFTDGYLAERFGGDNQDDLGHLLAALTRHPDAASEADQLSLVSVDDVVALTDGRVEATVTTANATERFTDVIVFANVDDRWLIDAVALGESNETATPTS